MMYDVITDLLSSWHVDYSFDSMPFPTYAFMAAGG